MTWRYFFTAWRLKPKVWSERAQVETFSCEDFQNTFFFPPGKSNAGYLSTQFLMETSLSQDVNRFDFNDPIEAYSSYSTNNVDSAPANSPDTTIVEENSPFSPDSEVF